MPFVAVYLECREELAEQKLLPAVTEKCTKNTVQLHYMHIE